MGTKKAEIQITANASQLPAGLRQAAQAVSIFARHTGASLAALHLGPKENKKRWWVAHAAGTVVGNMVNRGISGIIDQGRQIFEFEDQMTRFGIVAHISGNEIRRVGKTIRELANETGLSANVIQEGARAYVDMAGASAYTDAKIRTMARTAQASETDIKTLSEVMFQLQHSMRVPDSQLEETLGGIIETSKEGAVHFSAMAQEINELAPQAARYGMIGREGVNQLTALMQVARTGFGSVSEMGTGITRVFSGLTMHAKEFRHYGVEIFNTAKDGTKTWKTFAQIFDMIKNNNVLSKNPELLRKAFGRSEADRTIRLWLEGTQKLKEFEAAGMSAGVVQRDLTTYTESASGRLAIAWEKMRNAAANAFTPERIQAFVDLVEKLGDKLEPIVGFFGKIADVAGKIEGWGEDINHFVTKDREGKYFGAEDYRKYVAFGGGQEMDTAKNREAAYEEMRVDYERARKMKDAMFEAERAGDKDKAAKMAYRVLEESRDAGRSWQFTRDAALAYVGGSGISIEKGRKLSAAASAEVLGKEYMEGGRSMAPKKEYRAMDMMDFIGTIRTGVFAENPEAVKALITLSDSLNFLNRTLNPTGDAQVAQSVIETMRLRNNNMQRSFPVMLQLDGNTVAKSVKLSTDQRRK